MSWLGNLLSGGIVKSVENLASEWIETNTEKAEAQAILIKTMDPNGKMRRDISTTVSRLYTVYIGLVTILILAQAFGLGESDNLKLAVENLIVLFIPITSLFGIIVGASFGVNGVNTRAEIDKLNMGKTQAH